MRYYSEEDVSEMLAKEFDEASSYSKPYSGVKMSDYPSIEIPHSNWHTGTPTEEGWYLVAYKCVHECRNKGKLEYFTMHILKDEFGYKDIRGRTSDDVWKAVAYQKIEPYKED